MQHIHVCHPKKPPPAKRGITQGGYWDGRREFHGNRRFLLGLIKYEVRPEWGTPYPCSMKNLASYQRRPMRTLKKAISNESATRKLVKFLNEPIVEGSKEREALYRLAEGMQLEEWGPDLIFKAFDDLDLVFFKGVLAKRTQISWLTQGEIRGKHGIRHPILGFCQTLGFGRTHIVLNASLTFKSRNPFAQMWNTMLHEMVVSDSCPST